MRSPAPLADTAECAARRARLSAPHMSGLVTYAAALRRGGLVVPDADPADGGAAARLLLLLETPGPKVGLSGLVSADNSSGTGANLRRFFAEAGIDRRDRVIWNTVPWVVQDGRPNRPLRAVEIAQGLALLPGFVSLLPHLRAVVLSGRVAGQAGPILSALRPDVALLRMPHPSPTYVCTSPDVSHRIRTTLAEAAARLAHPIDHPIERIS